VFAAMKNKVTAMKETDIKRRLIKMRYIDEIGYIENIQ
jgi:hypothetical protein